MDIAIYLNQVICIQIQNLIQVNLREIKNVLMYMVPIINIVFILSNCLVHLYNNV